MQGARQYRLYDAPPSQSQRPHTPEVEPRLYSEPIIRSEERDFLEQSRTDAEMLVAHPHSANTGAQLLRELHGIQRQRAQLETRESLARASVERLQRESVEHSHRKRSQSVALPDLNQEVSSCYTGLLTANNL